MRRYLLYVLAFLVLTIVPTCQEDRYELKEDKEGRIVRLDKKSGDVVILSGDKMIKVMTSAEVEADRKLKEAKAASLSRAKDWPTIQIPQIGGKSVILRTMWKDGYIYYDLTFTPVPTKYTGFGDPFTIVFYNASSFKVLEQQISFSDLAHMKDSNDVSLSLEAEGTFLCTQEMYEQIASWNIYWKF